MKLETVWFMSSLHGTEAVVQWFQVLVPICHTVTLYQYMVDSIAVVVCYMMDFNQLWTNTHSFLHLTLLFKESMALRLTHAFILKTLQTYSLLVAHKKTRSPAQTHFSYNTNSTALLTLNGGTGSSLGIHWNNCCTNYEVEAIEWALLKRLFSS